VARPYHDVGLALPELLAVTLVEPLLVPDHLVSQHEIRRKFLKIPTALHDPKVAKTVHSIFGVSQGFRILFLSKKQNLHQKPPRIIPVSCYSPDSVWSSTVFWIYR
jgi:hypothetical protein